MNIVNKEETIKILQNGGTVIFPTETSYGLGCDATNQEAVDNIFKIKGRRSDKPLLVVVPTITMAKEYLEWNDLLEELSTKYWFNRHSLSEGGPGPLTVVGKSRNNKLAKGVVGVDGTVAVRVTGSEIPKYLSEKLGGPVVATSANLADAGDVYDSVELIKMYNDREFQPDAIIDAGVLLPKLPTTIVSVIGGELKVLRQGEIKIIL
jgi:L-threonylcarbamoyladenylate synthase